MVGLRPLMWQIAFANVVMDLLRAAPASLGKLPSVVYLLWWLRLACCPCSVAAWRLGVLALHRVAFAYCGSLRRGQLLLFTFENKNRLWNYGSQRQSWPPQEDAYNVLAKDIHGPWPKE